MEGQRQYYTRGGQYSEKKMMRNRRELDHDQSTDIAIVDAIDKLKKSQLGNGGYCQQGKGSNSYESVEIYVKRTSQTPCHDHAAFKYQEMETVNKVKLQEDEEELFISRMISHEKLRSEKWLNELKNKKEFMWRILQEMKSQGVQNIYDEESFIRIVLEKKSEFVGKSNSHGSNQSLVISKDKVSSCHGCQQNSTEHVSEYTTASTEVMNSMDQLSEKELSFIKEMMSNCEEIKEFSSKEDFIKEFIGEMKMQGFKDICNKESFSKFVAEKKSKMQETSNQSSSTQMVSCNGHGSSDGYNEVAAYQEFSNSEVSFVKRMISSQKINWKREFSSQKDREAFMYSIIRQMKREGIKNICNEEYFVKRIHDEMKRIHQEEKHKQMQRMNGGGGYQVFRQEIITQYDNGGYQRMGGYHAGGAYGGAGQRINGYGGEYNYEDDFHGQAMRQKKMITGQHKYQQGGAEGYAYGKYYK